MKLLQEKDKFVEVASEKITEVKKAIEKKKKHRKEKSCSACQIQSCDCKKRQSTKTLQKACEIQNCPGLKKQ